MHKTISVFFSGTPFSIKSTTYLAAFLYSKTEENEQQIKFGFDGCGVVYPVLGTIFGKGLDEQCDEVIQRIAEEIGAGNEITLNVYGVSRGAVAAPMLVQQLSSVDPNKLSINMALLDPVPGNLITTSNLDPFNITLANKVMDLTGCKPLKKVLALYPHKPLPDLSFHAPLFLSYPEGIELEEDVIAGCHVQAENLYSSAAIIATFRVEEFFVNNGTQFSHTFMDYTNKELVEKTYNDQYETEKQNLLGQSTRSTHSAKDLYIDTKLGAKYFNKHHKRLDNGAEEATVALTIQQRQSRGLSAFLKRTIAAHPDAWHNLKWAFLSTVLPSILFFKGALGAIPLVATIVAAPIEGFALAKLWYGAIKPVLSWSINRIFYPRYSLRNTIASPLEIGKESPNQVLDLLSDGRLPRKNKQPGVEPFHGKGVFATKPSIATIRPSISLTPFDGVRI